MSSAPSPDGPRQMMPRYWYSISVTTGRRLLRLSAAVAIGLAVWLGYMHWRSQQVEREATAALQEGSRMLRKARGLVQSTEHEDLYNQAQELHKSGQGSLAAEEYVESLSYSERALSRLTEIVMTSAAGQGEVRFMRLAGQVQYRRGQGNWRSARPNIGLRPGDWVQTKDGTAELLYSDGGLLTLQPNTMVRIGSEQADSRADMESTDLVTGELEVGTRATGRRVTTPRSEAQIGEDSEGVVAFDDRRERGRFAAFRGSIRVRSASGEEREVGALEQLEQRGDNLSSLRPLPPAPKLTQPEPGSETDLAKTDRLVLAWQPVQQARSYHLRVAASPLFAASLIDVSNRTRALATLGLRGEGSFFWQVAAVGRNGLAGPWSTVGSFRVVAAHGLGEVDDRVPPELEIQSIELYGSQIIVSGLTEAGSRVEINGEPIAILADGSFKKSVPSDGSLTVEVVATDSWGNETRVTKDLNSNP